MMPLQLTPLASGSKGNALLVESETTTLLLDLGIGPRDLAARFSLLGRTLPQIDGLLVSHTHSDHIKGIEAFARKTSVNVYAEEEAWRTLDLLVDVPEKNRRAFDGAFAVGDIGVYPFDTPHDAPHSKGFCFVCGGQKLGVATDLGHMTASIFSKIADCNAVFLESNYDEAMLAGGSYPPVLKRRIAGENGHLSNAAAAATLTELARRGVRYVTLGHLSENNNTPEKAYDAAVSALAACGGTDEVALAVAPQRAPGKLMRCV